MARAHQILVVDDDRTIVELVSMSLITKGYTVKAASDGAKALEWLAREKPDLILLDIMMPKVDGLAVCERIRRKSRVPIIMLSALEQEDSKVRALEAGADDYLTKPFGTRELIARVRAALRRAAPAPRERRKATFRFGNLHIDLVRRRASVGQEELRLTPIEYGLLHELASQPNRTVSHEHLLSQVWGPAYRDSIQYLHVYVGRLRRKLAKAKGIKVISQPGVGYMLKTST
jgi:two-component system KDP operon response regulator KdpE